MNIKLIYPIMRGIVGFKTCVCDYLNLAQHVVWHHENDKDPYKENKLDDYMVSLKLVDLNDSFEKKLTEEQRKALIFFKYHNPDETKPSNYEESMRCVYQKWLHTFFDERLQPRILKRIDYRFLGKVMKRIRKHTELSKIEVCKALGIIPRTIDRYETGQSTPSLEYIVSFCSLFHISIDELMEHAIK